jgi:hypothetical protein
MVKGAMPLIASFMVVSSASATAYGFWHENTQPTRSAAAIGTPAHLSSLLEAPDCASPTAEATAETTAAAGDDGSVAVQQLVVVVPPTVIVRLDSDGQLVSVSTNTGCAPRPADEWWALQPDGTAARTSATSFDRQQWVGDFTQTGVAQAQS